MPIHDLLERSKPTFGAGAFCFGMLAAVGAYGIAMLMTPERSAGAGWTPDYWTPLLVAGLAAIAGGALVERGAPIGVSATVLPALAVALGFGVAISFLVLVLPGGWGLPRLDTFASMMPLPLQPEEHELADGRDVFGAYLVSGGLAALAGFGFGSGGALLVVLLQVLAWAALLGANGVGAGGVPHGILPMLKEAGAAAPFALPALVGMTMLGCSARLTIRRTLGGGQSEDRSLRAPGLAALIGLLCMLLAGGVELFGGGTLARLLGH